MTKLIIFMMSAITLGMVLSGLALIAYVWSATLIFIAKVTITSIVVSALLLLILVTMVVIHDLK
jgi:hypothetical protein